MQSKNQHCIFLFPANNTVAQHQIDEFTNKYLWERFLEYGPRTYNKSHAAARAVLAYEVAWLKVKKLL